MLSLERYHHYLESHVYINLEKTPRQENAQTIETQKEDAKTCFSETARLATNTPWIMSNKQPARWSGAAKMFGNPGKRQRQEGQRRWPKKEDEYAWQKNQADTFPSPDTHHITSYTFNTRSWRLMDKAYWFAQIGFDAPAKEPRKVCCSGSRALIKSVSGLAPQRAVQRA